MNTKNFVNQFPSKNPLRRSRNQNSQGLSSMAVKMSYFGTADNIFLQKLRCNNCDNLWGMNARTCKLVLDPP